MNYLRYLIGIWVAAVIMYASIPQDTPDRGVVIVVLSLASVGLTMIILSTYAYEVWGSKTKGVQYHYHPNEHGLLVKCYHKGKKLLFTIEFWIGVTLSFPLEHFIWEKVWPFYLLTEWLGL